MKKFIYGMVLGFVIGVGVGRLVFSKNGQRTIDKKVDAIQRNVNEGIQKVDEKINEVTK